MYFTSAIALFAAVVAAVKEPITQSTGMAIRTPSLHQEVEKGAPFTITWDVTNPAENKVSLVLRKGPSENNSPIATIAEAIDNTGSFVWNVPASLENSEEGQGYGLHIVDEVTGEFQYSTQFGIIGDAVTLSTSSSGSDGYPTGAPSSAASSSMVYPTEISTSINSTTPYPTKIHSSKQTASTGYPVTNSTMIVQPTKTPSIPASLKTSTATDVPTGTSSTTTGLPESTGAASALKAGMSLVGGVAALVALL